MFQDASGGLSVVDVAKNTSRILMSNQTFVSIPNVNLGQVHTSISANFPQNTTLIKISPKIALFEVLVEPYKNRTISRIALIK